jgi:hypothetical protein
MQPVGVSIVFAALILLGALPAAGQSAPPAVPPQTGASSDPAPGHDTYLETARADLQQWRGELDAFAATAEAEGRADSRAAADRLNVAWANTRAAAGKLQAAGAEGWERARASFEDTSRDFTEAFDKVRARHNAPPAQ